MNLIRNLLVIAVSCFLITFVKSEEGDTPTVKIPQGELRGTFLKSRDGRPYSAYMGIPYGKKPEKFEVAEPAPKWDGIRDASRFGSVCPQANIMIHFSDDKYVGDEDCLFVNVFTPDEFGDRPVLVFIHGGAFQFGNSDENGAAYLMDEEVVYVSINYRLGALGFLSTGTDDIPGNLGLKDQLLALKWLQTNIQYFGGDKNRITLFGESAGGASVSYHVISEASKGLFRSAIQQSGSSLNPWALVANPRKRAEELGKRLECPTESPKELKKCLKSKTAKEIISQNLMTGPLDNPVVFAPTIEAPSKHAFITEHPLESYKNERFAKVPLLLTVCEKEGLLINAGMIVKNQALKRQVNENWNEMAPVMFFYDLPEVPQESKDKISARLKSYYFNDKFVSDQTLDNLTDVYSDSSFIHGVRNTALYHAPHAEVYTAVFAYQNGIWSQIFNLGFTKYMGMTHADDLPYLFNNEKYPPFVKKSQPEMVSKLIVKAFAAFAEHGNPNFMQDEKSWEPISKKQIESKKLKWLYVKFMPKIESKPLKDRMALWDKIYTKIESSTSPPQKTEL